jgi:hypothetical protein
VIDFPIVAWINVSLSVPMMYGGTDRMTARLEESVSSFEAVPTVHMQLDMSTCSSS